MRPVIGLTAYVEPARWVAWNTDAALLHAWYPEAVIRSGGIPVMLPPQQEAAVALASRIDALILTGGPDISATMYGQDPHPTNDRPRHLRDEFEVAMYRAVREAGKPVLGVCRGLQIMAVAEGGYLTQHLPDVTDLPHREKVGAFTEHGAMFAPDSIAHRLLGAETVELDLDIDGLQIDIGAPVGIVAARRSDDRLPIDADGNTRIQPRLADGRCFRSGIAL